jgi:hypothetical protein
VNHTYIFIKIKNPKKLMMVMKLLNLLVTVYISELDKANILELPNCFIRRIDFTEL